MTKQDVLIVIFAAALIGVFGEITRQIIDRYLRRRQ